MDDHFAGAKDLLVDIAEPESVGTDVAADCRDPPSGHLSERLGASRCGALLPKTIKGFVLQQFFLHASGGWRALTLAHEQYELAVGNRPQQPFDECGADKSG